VIVGRSLIAAIILAGAQAGFPADLPNKGQGLATPPAGSVAQQAVRPPFLDSPPKIDGHLDEACWEKPILDNDFISYNPRFGDVIPQKTLVFAAYDKTAVYFAFRCFDAEPSKIKTTVARRDAIFNDDWIGLSIDSQGLRPQVVDRFPGLVHLRSRDRGPPRLRRPLRKARLGSRTDAGSRRAGRPLLRHEKKPVLQGLLSLAALRPGLIPGGGASKSIFSYVAENLSLNHALPPIFFLEHF